MLDRSDVERVALRVVGKGHLFDGCSKAEVDKVLGAGLINKYPPQEHIFWKADPGQALYAVIAGTVQIRLSSDGTELVLAELGEGDVFGEMSLVTHGGRSASAVTMTQVELFVLNDAELQELMTYEPKVAAKLLFNLLRITSQRLGGQLARLAGEAPPPQPAD